MEQSRDHSVDGEHATTYSLCQWTVIIACQCQQALYNSLPKKNKFTILERLLPNLRRMDMEWYPVGCLLHRHHTQSDRSSLSNTGIPVHDKYLIQSTNTKEMRWCHSMHDGTIYTKCVGKAASVNEWMCVWINDTKYRLRVRTLYIVPVQRP